LPFQPNEKLEIPNFWTDFYKNRNWGVAGSNAKIAKFFFTKDLKLVKPLVFVACRMLALGVTLARKRLIAELLHQGERFK
jgi:hypothetical protein